MVGSGSISFPAGSGASTRRWGSGRARNIIVVDTTTVPNTSPSCANCGRRVGRTSGGTSYADYNFCTGGGVNQPTAVAPSVARLVKATADTGRDCGALILQMVIADETDEAAMA